MFVAGRAGYRCDVGEAGIPAPGTSTRPVERYVTALAGHAARGWSCPHCAVENFRAARDASEVVECDYCGRAFAMPV
jgi:ribosomal protein L37AE/L43A